MLDQPNHFKLSKIIVIALAIILVILSTIYLARQFRSANNLTSQPTTSPSQQSPLPIKSDASNAISPTTSISPVQSKSSPVAVASAKSSSSPTVSPTPVKSETKVEPTSSTKSDQPPLLLKNLGLNLGNYDPATGKAGDLVFTKEKLQFGVLFTEYGFTIPSSMSASGQDKRNPQPTWIAPLGTKVRSIVDGVVTNITTLYSGDYSIMVSTDSKSQWQYETEHVINPIVKVGDKVTAGQIIAEVSPHNKDGNAGFGLVEIGILKGGNPPQHICPFAYLDPSVKNELQQQLLAFYKSWEEYKGDTTLHKEESQATPGCLSLDPIDG